MRAKVKVVEESVLFVAYVDECGIQSGHQFLDFCQVYVADGVGDVARLLLERYEARVFEQCD